MGEYYRWVDSRDESLQSLWMSWRGGGHGCMHCWSFGFVDKLISLRKLCVACYLDVQIFSCLIVLWDILLRSISDQTSQSNSNRIFNWWSRPLTWPLTLVMGLWHGHLTVETVIWLEELRKLVLGAQGSLQWWGHWSRRLVMINFRLVISGRYQFITRQHTRP